MPKLPFASFRTVTWLGACLLGSAPLLHAQTLPNLDESPLSVALSEASARELGGAEKTLTLDELIDMVTTNNTELLAAQQGRIGALAGIRAASAYANPRVEWQSGRNQARLPGTVAGSMQGWSVAQLVENPSARSARIDGAEAGARGAEQFVSISRNAVVGETKLRASEYHLRRAEAAMGAENLALLQQVRDRVQLRVSSGEAARYELIKADAEIVNARERLQTARLHADQVLVALNRLAAGKLPARWTLAGSLEEKALPLPSLDAVQQRALEGNPELRALQAEVDRAEARLRGARASVLPGVEVRVGQTTEPEVRQSHVGFSIQVPLFDRREGVIAEAAADLERLRGRLDGRRAELREQIRLARQALEIATLRVQALDKGVVKNAEAALRVAQAAYQFGERGILDVLDAQRVLRAARADLLQARYQVQAARIELDTLTGRFSAPPQTQP